MNIYEKLRRSQHKNNNEMEKEMTITELVKKINKEIDGKKLDRNVINRIEAGQEPTLTQLVAYSKVFNVSTDYLLGRTNTQATTYSVNNINDSSVVQGNGSVFGNASISVASTSENDSNNISLSKEEIGILDLYRSLDIRDRAKFMNFVFDMEDKATKA